MNQLFASRAVRTFNLLSIGQRGVGKTVFLAGSYAELHPKHKASPQKLWFDSQDSQEREKIEKILNYVSQSGEYPPPTMKITNFNFSLKRQNLWGTQTLCHFRWWDVPGESCNIQNHEFQQIVLNSHGCCVAIDADALLNDRTYLQPLEEITHQVVAIASLAYQHQLPYSFALVFTKCDLLKAEPSSLLQFEEKIQPLLARLDAVKAKYQRFYSAIPIVSLAGVPQLKATGAAAPLLWLVSQLSKLHYLQPAQQDLASGLQQSLANSSKASTRQKVLGLGLPLHWGGYNTLLASVGISLLAVSIGLFFGLKPFAPKNSYEEVLQRDPENFQALVELANQRVQMQQYDQAIPLIEKLVRQEPDRLDLQLNLAQLYQTVGQKQKAETAYDQILLQEKDNLAALVNKAVLRSEQGDDEMARTLFVRAEKAAPSSLKAKIRAIAQNALSPTAESKPVAR